MNKELAISILRGDVLGTNEQTHEAVFMAIKALKAEPVIRCKDCMYADSYYHCTWVNFWGTADDYCSRAKSKMDEVNDDK